MAVHFRSLEDLGKSGYPAESMLFEALLQTFHGKYFYFGFKLSGTSHSQSATLKDVLKCTSDESQTSSQLENNIDNSHTLVYQILPNAASSLVTVTDHMRKTVSLLKHGKASVDTLSHRKDVRSVSTLSECSSARSDSISSCKNSYIDNSKQESVAFSFEESDTSCKSRSRIQNRDTFAKENQSYITCRKSGKTQRNHVHNDCTFGLNLNGTFIPNFHAKDHNQSVNRTADITSTFTNEIIKQLAYNTTGELGVSNTCSRIDHELREREIKRKVENFSRCILLSQQSEQGSQRENLNRESIRNKAQNVSHSRISNIVSVPVSEKQILQETKHVKVNNGVSGQPFPNCDNPHFQSTDPALSKTSDQNLVPDLEDSHSLTAFLESQAKVSENGANTFEEQDTQTQCEVMVNSIHECEDKWDVSENDESLKILQIHKESGDAREKNNTISQVSELVREDLPYSEGLDTFFGTQFTHEQLENFEEEEVDDNTKSHKKPRKVSNLKTPLQNGTCTPNGMQADDFIDLPESECLEAFLSTFDDGIKDSGLFSDNTATSLEHNEKSKNSVNKEKSTTRKSQGRVSFQKTATFDNPLIQSHNSEQLNTEAVSKSDNPSHISANFSTDSELDSFLANISDEFKVIEEGNNKTSEISHESLNVHLQDNEIWPLNCTSNSNTYETPKIITNTNNRSEYYLDKNKIDAFSQNSLKKTNTGNDCSLDLEEYLDGINTLKEVVQHIEAITVSPTVAEVPTNEKDDDCKAEETYLEQESVKEKKTIISETETCSDLKRREICSDEDLNDICYDRTDTIQDKKGYLYPSMTSYIDGNVLAKKKIESLSLSHGNSLYMSDDSCWDDLHENSLSVHSDLDNALISLQNDSQNDFVVSGANSFPEKDTESCSDFIIPGLPVQSSAHAGPLVELTENIKELVQTPLLVNSSCDLFEDSYCSPNVKVQPVLLAGQEKVLVGDSDTDKSKDTSCESDDSFIMDSPNTVVDDKNARGDGLASLFRSKLHVPAVEREETVKNVKFHRQLRRVSSCQLMDIKMKLNASPHRKRKVRRKSILKVKHNDKLKQRSPNNDNVSCDLKRASLDILEEKSHLLMTRNIDRRENGSDASVVGSQDLFSPSPTDIINNILDHYIDTRKAAEKLKDPSVIETSDNLEMHTGSGDKKSDNSIASAEQSGSQDLFSQGPGVNQNDSRQLSPGDSAALNVLDVLENNSNHKKTVADEFKHSLFDVSEDKRNSNQLARKQAWLRDVLLDVTNTPNDFNKTYVQESKQPVSKIGYQIIADTPDLNACQNENLPVVLGRRVTEREAIKTKILGEMNVLNARERLKVNSGVNTSRSQSSDVSVEGSPDLFADSPDVSTNVSLSSKSNVKLFPALLCKKLFS